MASFTLEEGSGASLLLDGDGSAAPHVASSDTMEMGRDSWGRVFVTAGSDEAQAPSRFPLTPPGGEATFVTR